MRIRHLASFFLLVLSADVRAQQPNSSAPSRNNDVSIGEFVLAPTNVASFQYRRNGYRIWQSIYNRPDNARLWQFRYDPLFKPDVTRDGALNISKNKVLGGKVKITLPILFDSTVAQRLAYESIQRSYPDDAPLIQPGSVEVLPVRSITGLTLVGTGQDSLVNQMLITKFTFRTFGDGWSLVR
jgi:hypothetical protein